MANFITCYDKDLQDLADFLKILVSANDSINNLDFSLVQFKNQDIVSKEYVLYLGEKSVHRKSQMFNDIYNKYHIIFPSNTPLNYIQLKLMYFLIPVFYNQR